MKSGIWWGVAAVAALLIAVSLFTGGNRGPQAAPDQVGFRQQQSPNAGVEDAAQAGERVARVAVNVERVQRAWATVAGNTAYVGLELERATSEDLIRQTERTVAEQVRDQVQGIESVLVSSNPDIVERIRGISQGVQDGRPVSEFQSELEDLGNRLRPRLNQ